ncbi:MAG: glycogen synthase GlgA [Candidatus Borkfalkiaceae bacterium]|nr:glycogen synthase GlgA [Christensenellaceae bacterium]
MATKKTVKTGKLPKITVSEKKKVIFVGSEAAPFIATGGLADVLGSLPKALAKRGNVEASVIIPLYGNISSEYRKNFEFITNFNVSVGWRWQYAGVFKYSLNGVNFYFIDNEYYFKREGNIYGFYDDGERFAFFSRAALDLIAWLNIYPDVLHCNDWHTAASIIYLKGMYYGNEKFRRIKTVFSIHNIEYQGVFGMDTYTDLFGFPDSLKQFVEFDGAVNLMKGAIEMTDVVSTVSPTYAEEIKNSYYAHGLENIINRNAYKLCGILNGIDTDYYNPETDKFLFANYSVNDLSGKKICKAELQKMLGLPVREDVPMIAIISRLVSHKGIDLIKGVIESLLSQDVQVVILGKGETSYENFFSHIASCYQGKCATVIAFNQDLSRKIYSGADIFLMPSKMEPCGLAQMISSRYGTVPVVRETGGLNDSIKPYTGESGNGFTFHDYNAHDMLYVINEAIRTYYDKNAWETLVKRVMTTDFSWGNQAGEYEKIYNK